ncbi:MAG: EAL domain-containing protein [Actinomycetota bacterium]
MTVRARLALWIAAAVVSVGCIGWFVVDTTERNVTEQVERDLSSIHTIERVRIEDELDELTRGAQSLADGPHVRDFVGGVVAARAAGAADDAIGGYDGFAEIDPFADRPLDQLATAMARKAATSGSPVRAVALVDPMGDRLGASAGATWAPADPDLVRNTVETDAVVYGDAFRSSSGEDLLGAVAPIRSDAGDVIGAVLLEIDLVSVVGFVDTYEAFGDTSEAHIAQPTASGDAEFITPLRFEPDAAFEKVVPSAAAKPINDSLTSPELQVVRADDYRDVDSILIIQTIEPTGWGLVVKIDAEEALRPVTTLRNGLLVAVLVAGFTFVAGWALLVRPIGRRLTRTAAAARRIADGDLSVELGDRHSDEIGEVATSIDRLAANLADDIDARADAERRLRHQVDHDELTGIYNRMYASAALTRLLDTADDLSLLFMDLDGFKQINDAHGHHVGDEVLVAVARRLDNAVSEPMFVARWGGDEFIVALPGVDEQTLASVAARVEELFAARIATSVGSFEIGSSVGVAVRRAGDGLDSLVSRADQAMFVKKQARIRSGHAAPRTTDLVESAIDDGRVELHLQPLVGLDPAPHLVGGEALVRLRDGNGRLVMPNDFLPQIEGSELSHRLDQRVAELAIAQLAEWRRRGVVDDGFRIGINLGPAALRSATTADWLAETLSAAGVPGSGLMVEVTEHAADIHVDLVERLRGLGVRVALDDIGLASSNIDRLIDVDASDAKIDRRWLREASEDAERHAAAPLRHLVSLCRELGKHVIVEGIETHEQLDIARRMGADSVQGFLFSRPVPATEFEGVVQGWAATTNAHLGAAVDVSAVGSDEPALVS